MTTIPPCVPIKYKMSVVVYSIVNGAAKSLKHFHHKCKITTFYYLHFLPLSTAINIDPELGDTLTDLYKDQATNIFIGVKVFFRNTGFTYTF